MNTLPKRQRRPDGGGAVGNLNSYNQKYTAVSSTLQRQLQVDAELEARIDCLSLRYAATKAGESDLRRELWIELKAAIASRSAEKIERMECERGLRMDC